jgi:vancomycin resistance protein YoaR
VSKLASRPRSIAALATGSAVICLASALGVPAGLAQPRARPAAPSHDFVETGHALVTRSRDLPPLPAGIVGRHETRFSLEDEARATNVRLAVSRIDGATLAPHRSLSFDQRVGPRTVDRGFLDAETLLNGVPTPGIGGGICQVATTLFVAAFTAGVPVPRVRPHSRLPHYAAPGMDAAIAEGRHDLVIENPFHEPLVVHARTEGDRLVVELTTTDAPLDVEWEATVEETLPPRERVERDRHLPAGERRILDEGATGWTVLRTRTVHQGEHVRRERTHVRYQAYPRVVRVGPTPAS